MKQLSVGVKGQIFSQPNFIIYGSKESLLDLQRAITTALEEGKATLVHSPPFYKNGYDVAIQVTKED